MTACCSSCFGMCIRQRNASRLAFLSCGESSQCTCEPLHGRTASCCGGGLSRGPDWQRMQRTIFAEPRRGCAFDIERTHRRSGACSESVTGRIRRRRLARRSGGISGGSAESSLRQRFAIRFSSSTSNCGLTFGCSVRPTVEFRFGPSRWTSTWCPGLQRPVGSAR